MDFVGFKFVKNETICCRPGLQMVMAWYSLGHSLSLGLGDEIGKAQTRNNFKIGSIVREKNAPSLSKSWKFLIEKREVI